MVQALGLEVLRGFDVDIDDNVISNGRAIDARAAAAAAAEMLVYFLMLSSARTWISVNLHASARLHVAAAWPISGLAHAIGLRCGFAKFKLNARMGLNTLGGGLGWGKGDREQNDAR
jgi:hypothetical protein